MKNNKFWKNSNVLITGGCGSIGSCILENLLQYNCKQIKIFDNSEEKLFYLNKKYKDYDNIRYIIGDIKDENKINSAMHEIDYVFHVAALKHVALCEYNPEEATNVNINGTLNLTRMARINKIKKFLLISTDKAANPINCMGISKLMAEKITLNAGITKETSFGVIRLGNVVGSSGSLIQIIKENIKNNLPIYVRGKNTTRFFIEKENCAKFIIETMELFENKQIHIPIMKSYNIYDLVQLYKNNIDNNCEIILQDLLPGEKEHEILFTKEELTHIIKENNRYIINTPINIPNSIIENKINCNIQYFNSNNHYKFNENEILKFFK